MPQGAPGTRLPSDTDAQKIGRSAAKIAGAWFTKPDRGLIWREGRQDEDFGVDGELELTGQTVSGLLVKAQIKGTRDTSRLQRGQPLGASVRAETMNYWAAIQLPVVVFLVDVDTDEIYWARPAQVFGADGRSVTFSPDRRLDADPLGFVAMLQRLAQMPAASAVLDHVPFFVEQWAQLRQAMAQYDGWRPVEPRTFALLELGYEHVLRLRRVLGLIEESIPPWTFWLSRSDYGFASSDHCADAVGLVPYVADEMLTYLNPLYIEALVRAGEIAKDWDVRSSHPRLAGLADAGVLEHEYLKALFEPFTIPANLAHVDLPVRLGEHEVLRSREDQLAFEAFLDAHGARRVAVGPARSQGLSNRGDL